MDPWARPRKQPHDETCLKALPHWTEKLIAASRCRRAHRGAAGNLASWRWWFPQDMFPASCFTCLESISLRVQAMGEQRATNPHRSVQLNCSTPSQGMGPALWAGKGSGVHAGDGNRRDAGDGNRRDAHHAHREVERHSPHPHAHGGATCMHCPRREVAFAAPPPKGTACGTLRKSRES